MRGRTGHRLVIALGLLLVVAAVDIAWLRPREARLTRLTAARDQALGELVTAERSRSMASAYLGYVEAREEPGADWLAAYRAMDPFTVLEHYRGMSGLQRRDMDLDERSSADGLDRTRYFLYLTGTKKQALTYIRSLELASPLIEVDSFVIETESRRKVSLRLHVSVIQPVKAGS